jgi:hypothetical protein
VDEESSSDMLRKELNIDCDDGINFEIEGETVSEKSSMKCQKVRVRARAKQVLLRVGGCEDVTMGDDATE